MYKKLSQQTGNVCWGNYCDFGCGEKDKNPKFQTSLKSIMLAKSEKKYLNGINIITDDEYEGFFKDNSNIDDREYHALARRQLENVAEKCEKNMKTIKFANLSIEHSIWDQLNALSRYY